MEKKNNHPFKARLGAIGEKLVAIKLMELGLDAINANDAIKNCKNYDLIAINPDNQKTAFIQVKTHEGTNFPLGYSIETVMSDDFINQLVGPWVFVYAYEKDNERKYDCYVLSKEQMATLAKEGHKWYYSWDRKGKSQPDKKSLAGMEMAWLKGEKDIKGSTMYPNKPKFENPLSQSAKDNWQVIIDELKS